MRCNRYAFIFILGLTFLTSFFSSNLHAASENCYGEFTGTTDQGYPVSLTVSDNNLSLSIGYVLHGPYCDTESSGTFSRSGITSSCTFNLVLPPINDSQSYQGTYNSTYDMWSGTWSAESSQTCEATGSGTWQATRKTAPQPSTLPVPDKQQSYSYAPVQSPAVSLDPAEAKPLGVGGCATGGDVISLRIAMSQYSGPVDIYLALLAPPGDANNIYLIKSDRSIQPLSMGLSPYKANTTAAIDEKLYGDIPTSTFPPGTYHLVVFVTPNESLETYYLWITSFVIPEPQLALPEGLVLLDSFNWEQPTGGVTFDGSYLWVADWKNSKIYELDTSGNLIRTLDAPGSRIFGLAYGEGHLFVTDRDNHKINKIELLFGSTVASFDSPGGEPNGLEFMKTHPFNATPPVLWNVDWVEKTIYKIDTSGHVLSSFPAPAINTSGIVFAGNYLWCSSYQTNFLGSTIGENKIFKMDTSGNVLASFDMPFPTYDLAFDGKYFWIRGDKKIYKVEVEGIPEEVSPIRGDVTVMSPDQISGWACDSNIPTQSIDIHIYIDGTLAAVIDASAPPLHTGSFDSLSYAFSCQGENHGFSWTPSSLTPGKHHVDVYAVTRSGAPNRLIDSGEITVPVFQDTHTAILKVINNFSLTQTIYLDEQQLGTVAPGQTRQWAVPIGHHTIRVWDSVTGSQSQSVTLTENAIYTLTISPSG